MTTAQMQDVETLVELFEESCSRRADAPMFGTRRGNDFEWTTYSEVHARVAKMRQLLHSLGVGTGDAVALIADNSEQWAVICYATLGLGGVVVPMYTTQSPADWEFILRDSGAKVLFMDARKAAKPFAPVRQALATFEHVIAIDGTDDDPTSLSSLLAAQSGEPRPTATVTANDPACYIYTSGTMGQPKGVILSHGNIVFDVTASLKRYPITSQDRTLAFLPWAHAFGQTADLHVMVRVGCQVAINGDISRLLTNLSLVKPTILVAVPRVFCRIHEVVRKKIAQTSKPVQRLFHRGVAAATRRANGERLTLSEKLWLGAADRIVFRKIREHFGGCLRYVISGSAALSQDVAEFVNAVGIEFYEGYGLTETSPIVAINYPGHRRFGTVGKPIPGVTIRIDKSASPDPSLGEILVSGPNVMVGYRGLPAETARAITPQGELRTGDLGRINEDGYLVVTGRIKEQFKLDNGRYVTPSPIEEKLKESSLIANCMLYGAGQPYCVLIVVPEPAAVAKAAQAKGAAFNDTASERAVYRLLKQDVASLTTEFTAFVRPKKLLVLDEDFTIENGLLTPSQKVRRYAVVEKYQDRLLSLYTERPTAAAPQQVLLC